LLTYRYPWELVNDPVMGGVSESNYTIVDDGAGGGSELRLVVGLFI
jgi:hypothetical protein